MCANNNKVNQKHFFTKIKYHWGIENAFQNVMLRIAIKPMHYILYSHRKFIKNKVDFLFEKMCTCSKLELLIWVERVEDRLLLFLGVSRQLFQKNAKELELSQALLLVSCCWNINIKKKGWRYLSSNNAVSLFSGFVNSATSVVIPNELLIYTWKIILLQY